MSSMRDRGERLRASQGLRALGGEQLAIEMRGWTVDGKGGSGRRWQEPISILHGDTSSPPPSSLCSLTAEDPGAHCYTESATRGKIHLIKILEVETTISR